MHCRRPWFNSRVGTSPWRRDRLPTPVFWPREFHGLYSDFQFHRCFDTSSKVEPGSPPFGFQDSLVINRVWWKRCYVTCEASSVQSLSCVKIFAFPWNAAHQASLSISNPQSLPELMSTESVMPSHPLSSPSPPAFNLSQHQGLFQ